MKGGELCTVLKPADSRVSKKKKNYSQTQLLPWMQQTPICACLEKGDAPCYENLSFSCSGGQEAPCD